MGSLHSIMNMLLIIHDTLHAPLSASASPMYQHNRLAVTVALTALGFVLQAPAPAVEHVIHISVDGLHAERLRHRMHAEPDAFTGMHRLVNEGVSTFNARADSTHTLTLPNHTSMITGRPVLQPGDDPTLHHGYTSNGMPLPTATLHNTGNQAVEYKASTFDVLHDHGYSTSLYASKTKFVLFEQSYNETEDTPTGRADQFMPNGDQGPNKIDNYVYAATGHSSTPLIDQFVADMAVDQFNYSFLHFRELDSIGHSFGWGSTEWEDGMRQVDQHLVRILDLIESTPGLQENTSVILTTDHGGWALSHLQPDEVNSYTIPVMAWGPDIAAGGDFYALNRYTRTEPGLTRPDFAAAGQPVRNGDTGNLALSLMGLPPIDGSSINSDHDLIVTHPSDATWHGTNANGMIGDGITWSDHRNWSRDSIADHRFYPGDRVTFSTTADQVVEIQMGHAQVVSSLDFLGSYRLTDGSLKVTSGNIDVVEGATVTIDTDITGPVAITKRGLGTLTLNGVAPNIFLSDGTLRGEASIGHVLNYGRIEPGDGIGTLAIDGILDNRAGTQFEFEIDGADTHDLIQVTAQATIRGPATLVFSAEFADATEPGTIEIMPLLQAGTLAGRFSPVTIEQGELTETMPNTDRPTVHMGEGVFRLLNYEANSFSLVSYSALPGDANGDLVVDVRDFNIWNDNKFADNTDWTSGDFTGDGVTDATDLSILSSNLFSAVALQAAVVPEPSSLVLLALASLILAISARREH